MNKVIAILALLAVATPALALERPRITPVRVDRMEAKEAAREDARVERREVKEEAKVKVVEARKDLMKAREDAKKELKTKLAKIKDTKKKATIERIDQSINDLNSKRADHYMDVLIKLSAVLDRVSERADRAAAKGVDVGTTRIATTEAKTAIISANADVKTQSEKVYKLLITDEATLKQKVGEVRQMLRDDLAKLQDAVKSVKEAVRKAATTLAKTPKVKDEAPEVVPPAATTSTNNQ